MDMAGQAPEFEPGSNFDGYTIDKMIGEGGMARLYLAHDESGRQRVLKVPRRTLDVDPVAVVAFENELRLARYLEDFPHAYMPVSQSDSERHYLVMDYIEGTDLWTHLLVIGARERRALSRFVLGSTAYKVLTTIKCPIFVVQEAAVRKERPFPSAPAPHAASASSAALPNVEHAPASYIS